MTSVLIDTYEEELVPASQTGAELGFPGDARAKAKRMYRLRELGCPAVRLGGRIYFQRGPVRTWLAAHATNNATEESPDLAVNERSGRRHGRPDYITNHTAAKATTIR